MGRTILARLAALALLSLAHAGPARASDVWLQPERFAMTPGALLVVGLTRGEEFNGPEFSIARDGVDRMVGSLGGEPLVTGPALAGERALQFGVTMPRPGVAVLGAELKPQGVELTGEKPGIFLRAIHAREDVRADWAALPAPRRWRESRCESAKTFIRVGEPPGDDRSWATPLGLGLEIVPEQDPTLLRENAVLAVRVLRAGLPLGGFVVAFVSAGETRDHVRVTDDDGRASAQLDAPGLWLVRGTDLRRSTAAGREWDGAATSMVVNVGTGDHRAAGTR